MDYEYDFCDSWHHELVFEKTVEKKPKQFYPVCIEGELNCPPEDCGGIYGFNDYLEILKDKKHPEYEDVNEWMGDYDPSEFDLKAINENLLDYKWIDMDVF